MLKLSKPNKITLSTSETPSKWWNAMMGIQDDSGIILKPSVTELKQIFFKISPVFTNGIPDTNDDEQYLGNFWEFVKKLMQNADIPDPRIDFTGFVQKLHNISRLVKITDTETAIILAQRLCPSEPADFFFNDFILLVSDPLIAIKAMYEMQNTNAEPWYSQIRAHGQIEKFLDLFITYLQPANSTEHDDIAQFRIFLADMLVNLLIDPKIDFRFKERHIVDLYIRLLNLVSYVTTDASGTFCRLLITLFDYYLKIHVRVEDDILIMIQSMYTSAPPSKASRSMVTQYIFSLVQNKTIAAHEASIILTVGNMSVYDMKILYQLGLESLEARLLVLKYFGQKFANEKILCYTIAPFLADLMKQERDKDINDFITDFFKKMFVKIAFASKKSKYVRRITAVAALISIYFRDVPKTWEYILQNASYAVKYGKAEFLKDYFEISNDDSSLEKFTKEIGLVEKFKPNLKYYPFKESTCKLVELDKNERKNKVSHKQSKAMVAELIEKGIPEHLVKYFRIADKANVMAQQAAIFEIEDFIDEEREDIKKLKIRIRRPKLSKFNLDSYETEGSIILAGQVTQMARNRLKILEFQMEIIQRVINIAKEVISLLRNYNDIISDAASIACELGLLGNSDAKYKLYKKRKLLLRKRLEILSAQWKSKNYKGLFMQQCSTGNIKFNMDTQYSRPSSADPMLKEVLLRSVTFKTKFIECSKSIETMSPPEIMQICWEFSNDIILYLKLKSNVTMSVIAIMVLRLLFENSYFLNKKAILANYQNYNAMFLIRAAKLAQQPIDSIGVSKKIYGSKEGSPIELFFKYCNEKYPTFEEISLQLSPIDINYVLYKIHRQLKEMHPAEEDLTPLFLALLVNSPPNNAISAAMSLKKFGEVNTTNEFKIPRNMYLDAINMVLSLKSVKEI